MTSGANCDAIRPLTSTIAMDPSGRTKNSMLKSDRSNPSAGISRAATPAMLACTSGPSALGYSNRRKLIAFGMHDRVGHADGRHPPVAHEALERHEDPVEQLLGHERPEAPPLEGDVVGGHGVDVGACLGQGGGVVGRPVASVRQLREVGADRLQEEGIRQRSRRIGVVEIDRGELRRRLGDDLGLDPSRLELVVAAHERRSPRARQAEALGQDGGEVAGGVARPHDARDGGPEPGHVLDERRRVEPGADRLPGQPDGEPLHDALVRQVQAVAPPGAEDEDARDVVGGRHRPDCDVLTGWGP